MMADRFGAFRVIVVGALLYAGGLVRMALSTTRLAFTGSAGVLIGAAQAGTTYAVVYGVIGRNVAPEKRSWAMGVAAAAGSFGQFLMVPVEGVLISAFGWQEALFILGCAALADPAARLRPAGAAISRHAARRREQSIGQALREAFSYPQLPAADGGLFRLRLPGRVHRRAHAELPEGQGPVAAGGELCAGADRPVQRVRHLCRRRARPAARRSARSWPSIYLLRACVDRAVPVGCRCRRGQRLCLRRA